MTPAYLLAECQKSGVLVELAAGVLKLKGLPDAVQIAADKLRPFKGDLVRYLDQLAAKQFPDTGEFRQVSRTAAAVDNVIGIRLALFHDRGLNRAAAIALADRLTVRDQQHDERRVCLECAHMAGTVHARRCGEWRKIGKSGSPMPADLVDILQRCRGFTAHPNQDNEGAP